MEYTVRKLPDGINFKHAEIEIDQLIFTRQTSLPTGTWSWVIRNVSINSSCEVLVSVRSKLCMPVFIGTLITPLNKVHIAAWVLPDTVNRFCRLPRTYPGT